MHGGEIVAEVLHAHGVPFVFTLSGGHISPILVACKARDIRVVDLRHEVNTVFAADAASRLSGIPGVAVVTAGPGVTNTVTAVKNAQMAQSPLVLIGGATATVLKGRGALQDIDQMRLMRPNVKWAASVTRLKDLGPVLERAFREAVAGVPGPVFVEAPVDLLYPEAVVRDWYIGSSTGGSLTAKLTRMYLRHHLDRMFAGGGEVPATTVSRPAVASPAARTLRRAAAMLQAAGQPLLLIGSQAVRDPARLDDLVAAIGQLGVPVYLTGMARGLLGPVHPLQRRHKRREALKEADMVLLAGVPCDFRLDYGRQIPRRARLVAVNLDAAALRLNRRPQLAVRADPGAFLIDLAGRMAAHGGADGAWRDRLAARDRDQATEIAGQAAAPGGLLDPLELCRAIDGMLADDSTIVADGGDFIATAAYTLRPRGPLSWLDPGPFGTLGVGAGFAIAAKLCRPASEVWLLYGDGSLGFSLAEFDSFVRHGLPVLALVGNDASWQQIARGQVEVLGDPVGTGLRRSDYHDAVAGLGARGLLLDDPGQTAQILDLAKRSVADGQPVLVNAHLGASEFRKGALSI